jgi:hypothetical protein
MRFVGLTLFTCGIVVLAGCQREEAQDAQRAIAVSDQVAARAKGPVGWLVAEAEKEKAAKQLQTQKLDGIIHDVQDLIGKARWDEAEAKAVEISWTPITAANNDTDKLLVEQYDAKRKTLLDVVHRHLPAR